MRVLLRVLAILALAVALTIAVKYNAGYVVIVDPPYRAEFSLSLMIVILLAAFFLAYGLLRLGAHTLNLPAEVHAFKQERQREKARAAMREGVEAFAAGHYAKAEKLAASAMEQGEEAETNALIAARCAHALGAFDRRDAYLAQTGKTCSDYPDSGMAHLSESG
jgi:HemY protein